MNWVTAVNSTYSTCPATGKRFNKVVAHLLVPLLIFLCFIQTAIPALIADRFKPEGYLAFRKSSPTHANFPDGYR